MTGSPREPNSVPAASGTRLDPWLGSYAQRAHDMRASEIRALFSVASRPEVVSLAGGMPFIGGLPLDDLGAAFHRVIRDQGEVALQYGSGQGQELLREQVTQVMKLEGISAHPDDVVITTGSQQALDLVATVFLDPGDIVVAEAPSYVGALGVFRAHSAQVTHVEMDDQGLIPAALSARFEELAAAGKQAKFLYTVPNFHNPAGVTLSVERRTEVLEICRRYGVLVLEDNPYGLLGFAGQVNPALRSWDEEGVIYLGSFSKTFAPGFRVGWAVAPHAVREKLILAAEAAILCPANASQLAISDYLQNFDWQDQISRFRDQYRERRDAMISALSTRLPQASWNVPNGGFYVWVKLPAGLDAKAMLPRAVTARVAYVPGTAFYFDGQGSDHMRLSFCYPTPEKITEGVRRLAGVVQAELATVELFGTDSSRPKTNVDFPAPDVF